MSITYIMTSTFLLAVLTIIFINVFKKLKGHDSKGISLALIGTTIFYVIMDCVWLSEYLTANYNQTLFTVLNFLFYAVYITLPFVWFRFSHYFIHGSTLKNRAFNIITAIPWLFNIALIVLTMLGTGTVWVIGDAANRYARGPMFSIFSNLNLVYYFIPVLEIVWKVLRGDKKGIRYYLSTLWFSIVPALGVFIYTYFIPETDIYPFQPFCFFLGIIFAYFFLVDQLDRANLIKRMEEKARRKKDEELYMTLILSLSESFSALFYITPDSGKYQFFVNDGDFKTKVEPNLASSGNFYSDIRESTANVICKDDRDAVSPLFSKETIEKNFGDATSFNVDFRIIVESAPVWYKAKVVKHLAADGREFFIIGIMNLESQLEQERQLKEALSMAQSANRAKTTFLNNMSHDIRTPMNAIIGYTGLAASHIDNKAQVQDYLYKISQSSDHLLSLINDVLDMSRIESGKMNLCEKEENLSEIIHTLRNIVHGEIHAKQLDFYVDAVDVNDESIICDRLRLNQVLLNILSNAIKYTPAGGTVAVRVSEKQVKANGYATYEFSIKDNGMGMSKEFLETVYEPFTRVKSSTVSGIQGTGLGMAISKNIIDMMGGDIRISSEPGKGTEVTITFDFKLQNAPKQPTEIPELRGVRALVVDDDSDTCISISKMVRDIGMRGEWCTSGKEAVIRASEACQISDRFKVYIIDWLMPDMNGIETTRRIRKVIGDDVPIIILTAYDWSDVEDEAMEAGVTAFVSKPMFPSDLHKALCDCLNKGKKNEARKPVVKSDFKSKKVLLVEDNEINREIAREILEEEGLAVFTAEDGDVAVEKMKSAKPGDYDIILMDIQMPRVDGYDATKQIREFNPDIPIVALSANAFAEDKVASIEAGMNDHIAKPINTTELFEAMSKLLK